MKAAKKNYVSIGVKAAIMLALLGLVIKLLAPILPHIILLAILFAAPIVLKKLNLEKDKPSVDELFPAITMEEWRANEAKKKEIQATRESGESVTAREVELCRAKVHADITACAEAASSSWKWANPNTAVKVYMTFDSNPNGIFEGELQMEGERVVGISVPTPDGTKILPNVPYLEAKRTAETAAKAAKAAEASARKDAFKRSLEQFFSTRKDGAPVVCTNLNPEKGTFTMTGPMGKFSVDSVKAAVDMADGEITAVKFRYKGEMKTIRRGKQGVATHDESLPAPHTDDSAAAEMKSESSAAADASAERASGKGTSSIPEGRPETDTAFASPTLSDKSRVKGKPEHASAPDFHQPCGLAQDALERHVKLYADACANTINSAALTAYNAGEEFCEVEFPEGLHTFEEVDAFGRLLTSTYNFISYKVLEDKGAIQLQLGEVNQENDSGLLSLVDEMTPVLSNEAADLYEATGEPWFTTNWPQEIDNIKAANEFCRLLLAQSDFDDFGVDPAGKLRLHLAVEEILARTPEDMDADGTFDTFDFEVPEEIVDVDVITGAGFSEPQGMDNDSIPGDSDFIVIDDEEFSSFDSVEPEIA